MPEVLIHDDESFERPAYRGQPVRAAARGDERGPQETRSGAHATPLHRPGRHQEPRIRAATPPLRRGGGGSLAARHQAAPRGRRAVRRRGSPGPRRARARGSEDARGLPAAPSRPGGDPPGGARSDRGRREGAGQGDGDRDATIQGTRRRQAGEPDRARGAGRDRMNGGGGAAPSVLETLEFPVALERVAAHAAGPLGAARVRSRTPATDPAAVRDALAQVAELAALLLTDDAIRAEPVPDIDATLELLAVPGGVLEGSALAQLTGDRAPDAGVTLRGGRYVIPIKSTARARVGGIVHDESATRATVFVEPAEVIELGNELRAAEAAEQREVLRVLRELSELARPHRESIARAWEMCIAFDDLCARARYAIEVNGFAPAIGSGPLTIRNGRHPLLVGGDTVVVPFDLALASDEFTVLVSGPNTGGKTVLIKAVGLLCLMAQSGIIPPIGPHSTLPVFTTWFADIGDRQSIAQSLSTFSAHVAVLRDILTRAGAGSLVLLDEIGSGTDPAEGAALAGAVLRTLTRRRAVPLPTSHLGALKQLATETVGVVNASLQFDAESLTPTYRLLKGLPGRSYGLAIAQRLGVPADVLAEAERALPETERAPDALLAAVEPRARGLAPGALSLAAAEQRVAEEREALAARERQLVDRERDVAARARSLDREARDQARAYLLEARKTVEQALAQARAAVDEATAKEARRLVEKAIEDTDWEEAGGKAGEGGRGRGWMSLEDLRRKDES